MPSASPSVILSALHRSGIGIREMADAAGLDPTHVSRIMRGELGKTGLAAAVAQKLGEGLEQLAARHDRLASACLNGARAIRRVPRRKR